MSIKSLQEQHDIMVKRDASRDQMFIEMDNMWNSRWALPPELESAMWVHKVVSTDAHDAIRSGTRVLSSASPRITIQPLAPGEENRASMDRLERALGWHFRNAGRRSRADIVADYVLSALLYDEVVAQVVYLPHQIKQAKGLKQNTNRMEAALRYGPFAVVVHNPKNVHITYSDWMPEDVLHKRVDSVEAIYNFWGEKASKLVKDRKNIKENNGSPYATVYDYMDYERRVVYAILQEKPDKIAMPSDGTAVVLLDEKHKLPFMPWVARVGGTNLFSDQQMQRVPLLWSLSQSGQWDTQNMLDTILYSEVIAYAGSPRLKIEGPTDEVEVDYGEPGRPAYVPPGHDLNEMRPPELDRSILALSQEISGRIAKSTLPKVLQTGDVPAGTPFSALNLITQSGLKALIPYKHLAEKALADTFRHMLYWIEDSKETVETFIPRRDKRGLQYTEQYAIEPDDFDVNNLYIDVELTADVPTDRMARVQAAVTLKEQMNYPTFKGMEQLGETDAADLMEQAREERKTDNEEAIALQAEQIRKLGDVQREEALKNAQVQMQIQQMQMQAQQQAQEQAQQQQGGGNGTLAAQLRNQQVQQQFAARRGVRQGPLAAGGAVSAQANPEELEGGGRERTATGEEIGG